MVAASTWIATAAAGWYVYGAVSGLPAESAVRAAGSMSRATTITDVKGRHAFTLFVEQRLPVSLSKVSPNLISAILAIEDRRFYRHGGLDVIRIGAAALHNVAAFDAEQGGSTITQQLARLSFLTSEKAFRRKLQEAILATRLERTFTKDQILELYLNKAYFGDGLYGVEAASLGYFGKHAAELSVAEAAVIAGLVKSPSTYNPTVSRDAAVARRDVVLGAMRDARVLDEPAYRAALATPMVLNDTLRREESYGQYFKEEVRAQLVTLFGGNRVYHEGLRVETTLDLDMQKAADAEVAAALDDIVRRQGRRARGVDPLQGALVAIDPRTGEVRAMVGGRDFAASRFNRVTQAYRQPGSAFKPFVYAAALERGFTPATLLTGLSQPVMTARGAWLPDDDHLEHDSLTMRAALRSSSNRAAVRMLETIGIPAAVDYAGRLGLGRMPRVSSLALGSGEVTLLSLASAFGAFAAAGQLAEPHLIRRVTTTDGTVLYEAKATVVRAVSPATAFLLTTMLEDVIDHGTGAGVRRLGFRSPAAGKTGTTNDYRDAWFVGYTPSIVTGVWVGYDRPRTIMPGGYAAQLAVPLWTRFMMKVTHPGEPERFKAPSDLTARDIDRASGRLATDACRRAGATIYTEYFAEGTEPIDICPLHRHDFFRALLGAPAPPLRDRPEVLAASAEPREADPPAAVPAVSPSAAAKDAEPAKKRGFWSRVFGRKAR